MSLDLTGHFLLEDIVVEAMKFVGRPLCTLLLAKMQLDELSVAQLAKRFSIGRSYLSQLLRGTKPLAAVSSDFLKDCAVYLGIPVVFAHVLAGRLTLDDFLVTSADPVQALDGAIQVIAGSGVAAATAVDAEMLTAMPVPVKQLMVLLYERSENVSLLPKANAQHLYYLCQQETPFQRRVNKLE